MIGFHIFLGLFGFVVITNVAARLDTEGIVGGIRAKEGQFPYVVSIHGDGAFLCTGGIIGNRHVLTAAHCFCDENGLYIDSNYQVVTGVSIENVDTQASNIRVQSIYIHPYYKPSVNDIAVVKVKFPKGSLPNLTKLTLPTYNSNYTGLTAVVAGYGDTRVEILENSQNHSDFTVNSYSDDHLNFAEISIMSSSECQLRYLQSVHINEICGSIKQLRKPEWKGLCNGDSGAPLVINNNIIIGVVSRGSILCRDDRLPTIYTKVSAQLLFIEMAIAGYITNEKRL